MQRIQVAGLELEAFDRVLQTGGNPVPIIKNYFESIGSGIVDQIYPDEGSMSPAELQQMQKMQEGQDLQNQIQQQQLQILQREQDRLDQKTAADIKKISVEIEKLQADIIKIFAESAKTGEEAETESLNNQINTYTTQMQMLRDELDIIGQAAAMPRAIPMV